MNVILELARILLLLFVIPAAFALGAWFVYRRYALRGLAGLWAVCSIVYGYLSFRGVCSRPVTCDVGSDPFSFYYLVHVAPPFAIAAAFSFGVIGLVIVLRSRRLGASSSPSRDLAWGTLAGVLVFLLAAPILKAPVW